MAVIDPDPKRLPEIMAAIPEDTPIVMLNLLRFREVAEYRDGPADYSGREAYRRYSEVALGKVKGVGGEPVWMGKTLAGVIAPADEHWDEVLLVRYPSRQAFQSMLADPEYREATRHRSAALSEARLIAMQER
ncbi:hypothetical protein A11A3_04305 [Alcanivorax hongdengensis A-11-3]|uniref:DUF1330 domain-containing protein n=1 Tax=Alcanivorax hongdengensis A-11-3 TaxID=1177179 RepID=L0WDQ1_9GAMM|nr:DUF1330 domain-containing protein [Alcanivorax hongdengensis]EKF75171.1 hypothetical protein A11A3_04305 [Alcanivorax hongdengensis A-11-3]